MEWFSSFVDWWTTARVAATAAAVGGGMAIVTGTTAIRTLGHNRKATRRSTRPMMVATLRPTGKMTAGIVITNVGQSIANNVAVSFDPPLPTHEQTADGQNSILPLVRRRFAKPIETWVPGYTAKSEFFVLGGEKDSEGRPTNVDGVPRETSIVFTYEDDDKNKYEDKLSLDPTLIEGESWTVNRRSKNGKESIDYDGSPWRSE